VRPRLTGFRPARPVSSLALAALLVCAGCQSTQPRGATQPAAVLQPAPPPRTNAELISYLADQPYVTAEAGYRAAYMLWKGTDFEGDYDALVSELVAGRLIGASWKHEREDRLSRAEVGYMICRACDIRSGLNWQLTGLGRYAWRELQYSQIARPSSEIGYVRGGEFVGMLSRAEEYVQKANKERAASIELGSRP
jgi:hypothetical protein